MECRCSEAVLSLVCLFWDLLYESEFMHSLPLPWWRQRTDVSRRLWQTMAWGPRLTSSPPQPPSTLLGGLRWDREVPYWNWTPGLSS